MIVFYWPWLALLFPLPLLIRLMWPRIHRENRQQTTESGRVTLTHPSLALLHQAFKGRPTRRFRLNNLRHFLRYVLWVLLVLAWMRPQWMETIYHTRIEGHDLMLALDTSRSMTALDFSPQSDAVSRMRGVKEIMKEFVKIRNSDRLGLIVFADTAFVQVPLTLDKASVIKGIDLIESGMIGHATALGDAIALSVKKLSLRPKDARVLVLITDGQNTAGFISPLTAAEYAKKERVKIYTISVGSNQPIVAMRGMDGQYTYESDVGADNALLQKISSMTGGHFYRATDQTALVKIYRDINQLQKTVSYNDVYVLPHPLYRWPLAGVMLLWLLMGLMPQSRVQRVSEND